MTSEKKTAHKEARVPQGPGQEIEARVAVRGRAETRMLVLARLSAELADKARAR